MIEQPDDPDDVPADGPPRRFLTVDQVSAELNISRSQTLALVRDGSLPAIKIGGRGHWRVERCWLEAFIARLYRQTEEGRTEDGQQD